MGAFLLKDGSLQIFDVDHGQFAQPREPRIRPKILYGGAFR